MSFDIVKTGLQPLTAPYKDSSLTTDSVAFLPKYGKAIQVENEIIIFERTTSFKVVQGGAYTAVQCLIESYY